MSESFEAQGKDFRGENQSVQFLKERLSTIRRIVDSDFFTQFVSDLKELEPNEQDYREMIADLEPEVIQMISQLEKKQILLRGDCLTYDEVDEKVLNKYLGAVRSEGPKEFSEDEKYEVLGLLLYEVLGRCKFAYAYERSQENPSPEKIPMVLFAFKNFESKKTENLKFDPKTYFQGHGDDIGMCWNEPYYIELPSGAGTKLFPRSYHLEDLGFDEEGIPVYSEPQILFEPNELDEKRLARITGNGKKCRFYDSIFMESRFIRPDSYFNGLLLVALILKEMKILLEE